MLCPRVFSAPIEADRGAAPSSVRFALDFLHRALVGESGQSAENATKPVQYHWIRKCFYFNFLPACV